jgi:hypothetical protein
MAVDEMLIVQRDGPTCADLTLNSFHGDPKRRSNLAGVGA